MNGVKPSELGKNISSKTCNIDNYRITVWNVALNSKLVLAVVIAALGINFITRLKGLFSHDPIYFKPRAFYLNLYKSFRFRYITVDIGAIQE